MQREPDTDISRLVGESDDAIFIVDGQGVIRYWNDASAKLLGRGPSAALGRHCFDILRGRLPTGETMCIPSCPILAGLSLGRGARSFDMVVSSRAASAKSGPSTRLLDVHHVAIRDQRGVPRALLHVASDVEEQRRLERIGLRVRAIQGGDRPSPALTPRETEVFRLIAAGLSAREVAERLGIKYGTARNHIHRVLQKLGTHSRAAAVLRVALGET